MAAVNKRHTTVGQKKSVGAAKPDARLHQVGVIMVADQTLEQWVGEGKDHFTSHTDLGFIRRGVPVYTRTDKTYKQKYYRASGVTGLARADNLKTETAVFADWAGLPRKRDVNNFDVRPVGVCVDDHPAVDKTTSINVMTTGTIDLWNSTSKRINNGQLIAFGFPEEVIDYNIDPMNGLTVPLYTVEFSKGSNTDWRQPGGIRVVEPWEQIFCNTPAHARVEKGAMPGGSMFVQLLADAQLGTLGTVADYTVKEMAQAYGDQHKFLQALDSRR